MAQDGQYTAATADTEAAAWAARLDAAGPDLPEPLSADLEAWLAINPRHGGALLRAQALLDLATSTVEAPPMPVADKPRRRRMFGMAALAVAASLALWLLVDLDGQNYATQHGELRRVALEDGSALTLDGASALRVDLDRDLREVELTKGRALFRVRHDAARPFRVAVDDITITDIGTVFSVGKDGDTVHVLISEGAVDIRMPQGQFRLTAGQSMTVTGSAAPQLSRIPTPAIERALAWASGRIDMDGETLDSAIAEFNRHNRAAIRLGDPALGRERLYGAFRLDDPEGFARAAALSTNAPLRAESGGWVIGAK